MRGGRCGRSGTNSVESSAMEDSKAGNSDGMLAITVVGMPE